jgi:hypothetical protein
VVTKQKKETSLDGESKKAATPQSLYCQFVYNYLLHCIYNHFPHASEDKDGNVNIINSERAYVLLFANMMKFFKCYIYSRSPVTVCWLLEILAVLAIKFKPDDAKLDQRVKAEYIDVLYTLLRSATMIVTDTFGIIKYREEFGIDKMAFSPTVYEMLKRYEFIKKKHPDIIAEQNEEALLNAIEEFRGSEADEKKKVRGGKTVANASTRENVNLIFPKWQLDKFDEIPLQKESMFESLAIVRDPTQVLRCAHLSEFMEGLNKYLHDDQIALDDNRQRAIFKVMMIVTLRQNLVPLVENIHPVDNKDG